MGVEKNRAGSWTYWRSNDISRDGLEQLLGGLSSGPCASASGSPECRLVPLCRESAEELLQADCGKRAFNVRYFHETGMKWKIAGLFGMSPGKLGFFHGEHAFMRGLPVVRVYACAVRGLCGPSLLVTAPLAEYGERFDRWLKQASVPAEVLEAALRGALDFLDQMHTCGIAHRRVTPRSLMVRQDLGGWVFSLLDTERLVFCGSEAPADRQVADRADFAAGLEQCASPESAARFQALAAERSPT